jgi:hypothetical protein
MKNVERMVATVLLSATALVIGCGTEPEANDESPQGEVPQVSEERQLLTTLSVSDTHRIEFWEYADGDVMVHESLNVDRDLADGRPTLAKMDSRGASLVDIYRNLAGARFENTVASMLGGADQRNLERARLAPPQAEPPVEEGDWVRDQVGGLSATSPSTIPTRPESPDGTAQVSSALACAEPAWDWVADVGWFKNNFCGNTSRACATEGPWWSYGWYRGPKNFKATAFAQSHCTTAHWLFQRKAYAGFPTYGISLSTLADWDLAPRTLDTQHWGTNGDRSWYCKVSSNTGENRTGLAVIW